MCHAAERDDRCQVRMPDVTTDIEKGARPRGWPVIRSPPLGLGLGLGRTFRFTINSFFFILFFSFFSLTPFSFS